MACLTSLSDMGYAEECERWASMGFSGSEAAEIAGSGVRPRFYPDDSDEDEKSEEELRDDAIELLIDRMRDRDHA
jgi:hypothetical protein